MESKYKKGDIVFERIRPTQKLTVKEVVYNVYYCQPEENKKRELVFLEHDLGLAGMNGMSK